MLELKKKSFMWNGKKYYLLGILDGEEIYLEQGHFDCGWYWGVGYVETFTNRKNPRRSKDISSHRHFDKLFKTYDMFMTLESPLSDKEKWTVYELMKSIYTARKYSDMLYGGNSGITTNPCKDIIKGGEEYQRINDIVIPSILKVLYGILEGTN